MKTAMLRRRRILDRLYAFDRPPEPPGPSPEAIAYLRSLPPGTVLDCDEHGRPRELSPEEALAIVQSVGLSRLEARLDARENQPASREAVGS